MTKYRYGAMSTAFELYAKDDLTAIAAIVSHYNRQSHLVVIYEPKDCPVWFNFNGKIKNRLDEIFQKQGGFEKFVETNHEDIATAISTIVKVAG